MPDVRVWRNNTGVADAFGGGGAVRYGLGVGSADLVGMVLPFGRFLALEVKTKSGRVSADQLRWIETVRRFGGVACVVRCIEDARDAVEFARRMP